MNRNDLYNSFSRIGDDLLERSEITFHKRYVWIKRCTAVICLCVIAAVSVGVTHSRGKAGSQIPENVTQHTYSSHKSSDTVPYGASEIYPTVRVRGKLYEWHAGGGLYSSIPEDYMYYGEINHTSGKVPVNECDFVSVFDATGSIYISNEKNDIYIRITADWLNSTVYAKFEPVK